MTPEIQSLIDEAAAIGWTVELKPYCEDAETPGFLGYAAGICVHRRKALKIATEGRTDAQIAAAIRHELAHAKGEDHADDDLEGGIVCGGTRNVFGIKLEKPQ